MIGSDALYRKGRGIPSFFCYVRAGRADGILRIWHTLKAMKRLHFPMLMLMLPAAVQASTLYKCSDDSGAVLYTNQKTPKKHCVVLSHSPMSAPAPSATPGAGATRPRASATPTPSDFPRVSGNEQKSRDNDRKAILDKELATETQGADKARKALQEAGTQPGDKLQALRDTLALHERNIDALKKEIGNLR